MAGAVCFMANAMFDMLKMGVVWRNDEENGRKRERGGEKNRKMRVCDTEH
jgi:hypothetical protein